MKPRTRPVLCASAFREILTDSSERIISLAMVIVSLPLAFACAASGGGMMGFLFAAILAVGLDMLTDTYKKTKVA